MKLQRVEPRQGAAWVRRGAQVFFRQPLGFAALFAACLFVFIVLRSLPLAKLNERAAVAGASAFTTGR